MLLNIFKLYFNKTDLKIKYSTQYNISHPFLIFSPFQMPSHMVEHSRSGGNTLSREISVASLSLDSSPPFQRSLLFCLFSIRTVWSSEPAHKHLSISALESICHWKTYLNEPESTPEKHLHFIDVSSTKEEVKSITREQGNAAYILCSCLIPMDTEWEDCNSI